MIKRIIPIIALCLVLGTADACAQNFFKKLGQAVEKSVKEGVEQIKKDVQGNKSNSNNKSTQNSSKSQANKSKAAQSDEYQRAVAAGNPKEEKRKITMPPADHKALFEPIGFPTTKGKLEWVCPVPPHPSKTKELETWAAGLKPVEELTNASLMKEQELLEPLTEREKYIINAIIGRYFAVNDELSARTKAIKNMIEKTHEIFNTANNMEVRESYAEMLIYYISLDAYKRALNSSIEPLRGYFESASNGSYFDKYGSMAELHKNTTKWDPYPDEAPETAIGDAVVGKLAASGRVVEYEGMAFNLYLKTAKGDYFKLVSVNKEAVEGKDVVVPARIMYKGKAYPVTDLGDAFLKTGIKSIVIPNTVKTIGSLGNLPNLQSVEIPSSVKELGSSCFANCPQLTEIRIPESVTKIGFFAFENCPKLTTAVLPKNMKKLEQGIFKDCPALKNVTLPENLEAIPDRFFYNCKGLTTINIPESVKAIGNEAFYGCSGLTAITLPSGLESIGMSAFQNCSRITSLRIPASVTDFGGSIVMGCKSLKTITMSKEYNNFYKLVGTFGGSEIFPMSYANTATIPPGFKFE